jgi:hypothetical protein
MISVGDFVTFMREPGVPRGVILNIEPAADGNVARAYIRLHEPILGYIHLVVTRDGRLTYHRVH